MPEIPHKAAQAAPNAVSSSMPSTENVLKFSMISFATYAPIEKDMLTVLTACGWRRLITRYSGYNRETRPTWRLQSNFDVYRLWNRNVICLLNLLHPTRHDTTVPPRMAARAKGLQKTWRPTPPPIPFLHASRGRTRRSWPFPLYPRHFELLRGKRFAMKVFCSWMQLSGERGCGIEFARSIVRQ